MAGRIAGITIEIGGDTTKLDKALSGVNKSIKTTQSSLKDVNKLLKLDPKNVDLLKQKQGYLTKAIDETKKKLDTEKQALAQLKANSTTDDVTEEQKALEREIAATETQLKSLTEEYKNFGSVSGQQIQLAGQKMQDIGKSVMNAGTAITKGVTVPITAAGAASVVAWKEVDGAMDVIIKKTGASGKPLEEMKKSAENIATTIPTSFETAATAIGEVNTRFGLTGTELESLSTKFVKFADLNDKDVSSSVDSVQKAMAAMNIDVKDAGVFLDTLNVAAQTSGIDVDTLTSSIVSNAAAFDGMGLSAGDVVGLLSNVEKSGVDTSTVMTGLKKAMQKATKEGKPASQALSEVEAAIKGAGTETEATKIAMELFGNKAGPAIAKAVRDGQISFEAMGTSLDDYAGSVESTFENTLDPLDKVDVVMNQLKATGASIVEASAPMIQAALEKLSSVVKTLSDRWNGLDDNTKQMVIKFALAAAAVGPLVVGLGGMILTVGKVTTGFGKIVGAIQGAGGLIGAISGGGGLIAKLGALATGFGPLLAGGAIVAGVVAGGVLIYKNWDKIKAGAVTLAKNIKSKWDSIKKTVTDKAKEIGEGAKKKFEELKKNAGTIFTNLGNEAKTKFATLKTNVVTMAQTIGANVKTKFEQLKTNAKTIFDNVTNNTKTAFSTLRTNVTTIAGDLASKAKSKFDELKSNATTIFENIVTTTKTKFSTMKTNLTTIAGDVGTKVKGKFDTLKTDAVDAVTTIASTAKDKFDEFKNNVVDSVTTTIDNAKKSFEELKTNVTTTVTNLAADAKAQFDQIKEDATNAAKELGANVKEAFDNAKTAVTETAGKIADGAKKSFDGMKTNVTNTVTKFGTGIKNKFTEIQEHIDKKVNKTTSNAETKFDSASTSVSTSTDNISKTVKDNLGPSAEMASSMFVTVGKAAKDDAGKGIKYAADKVENLDKKMDKTESDHFVSEVDSAGNAAKNDLGNPVSTATSGISNMSYKLNHMSVKSFLDKMYKAGKNAASLDSKLGGAESSAGSLQDKLKGLGGTTVTMPSIKLPHFSLNWGEWTVLGKTFKFPKSVSVSWYKKAYENAMMFTRPTVLQTPYGMKGFGDGNGGEIVLSDKKLREIAGGGATYNINIYGAEGQNVNELANAVQRRLVALERQREAAGFA